MATRISNIANSVWRRVWVLAKMEANWQRVVATLTP